MITITFEPYEGEEYLEKFKHGITRQFGEADKVIVKYEDESDPESPYALWFHYSSVKMENFALWENLGGYAEVRKKYVIVYDHLNSKRKGFWYDEELEWIEQDIDLPEAIKALA
jgi:sugar-specific transcriptional regulator TrmB